MPNFIDQRSCTSVLVDLYAVAPPSIGAGSGFFLIDGGDAFLVTNHHVISGRHQETNEPMDPQAHLPDRVLLAIPQALAKLPDGRAQLGWAASVHMLIDEEDAPLWCTHPTRGRAVDVAVLPLGRASGLSLAPDCAYSLDPGPDLLVQVGSDVSIIGFPEKLQTALLTAIWKSGHVASEPSLDIEQLPYFWIDAAGAPGMSGSPVLARRTGTVAFANGDLIAGTGNHDRLLGIYSGRARADTSLGRCWKWSAVDETVRDALRRVRTGELRPRTGQLGTFARPDDIRIPRIAEDGRWLTLLAEQLAGAAVETLVLARLIARLRAALQNVAEPDSIVLTPADAVAIAGWLEKLPPEPRVTALLEAIRAQLQGQG